MGSHDVFPQPHSLPTILQRNAGRNCLPIAMPLPPENRHDEEEVESPSRSDAEKELDELRPEQNVSNPRLQLHNQPSTQSVRGTISLDKHVSLPREIVVIGIISLAQFTTQVGLGQGLSILHVIGDDFGISDPGILSWLIAGYSLVVGTFILLSGRVGDIYGYKRMLVFGFAWFAVWSMVAGLSVYSNYVLFIFARVLSGLGPSICLPNGLALLGILYEPGPRKNMAFSVFGACAPGGSIVGATFGGVFALAWWPCEFACTLCLWWRSEPH